MRPRLRSAMLPAALSAAALSAAALSAAALSAAGCGAGATETTELRLPLFRLDVPATARAGGPVVVGIQFGTSPCYTSRSVASRTRSPGVVELEVRARSTSGPQSACPDLLAFRDTTYVVTAPAAGELVVVGLQPDGAPLERRVTVARP